MQLQVPDFKMARITHYFMYTLYSQARLRNTLEIFSVDDSIIQSIAYFTYFFCENFIISHFKISILLDNFTFYCIWCMIRVNISDIHNHVISRLVCTSIDICFIFSLKIAVSCE